MAEIIWIRMCLHNLSKNEDNVQGATRQNDKFLSGYSFLNNYILQFLAPQVFQLRDTFIYRLYTIIFSLHKF